MPPEKDPPLDPGWKTRSSDRVMFEAAASFSSSADRIVASVDRLSGRLGAGVPQLTIAALIVVVGVSALVGSVTALAWTHNAPARAVAQERP